LGAAAAPTSPGERRVLVVDDDPTFRRMLVAALEDEGFVILGAATDGLEGVALAHALRPDAIMLDVRMPGLDGLAAGRRIRLNDPDVRIVFLSAYDDATLQREAEALGATGFLVKGCRLAELVSALA
jgi:two-component system nitrate/nitrite response regulator NarL